MVRYRLVGSGVFGDGDGDGDDYENGKGDGNGNIGFARKLTLS